MIPIENNLWESDDNQIRDKPFINPNNLNTIDAYGGH